MEIASNFKPTSVLDEGLSLESATESDFVRVLFLHYISRTFFYPFKFRSCGRISKIYKSQLAVFISKTETKVCLRKEATRRWVLSQLFLFPLYDMTMLLILSRRDVVARNVIVFIALYKNHPLDQASILPRIPFVYCAMNPIHKYTRISLGPPILGTVCYIYIYIYTIGLGRHLNAFKFHPRAQPWRRFKHPNNMPNNVPLNKYLTYNTNPISIWLFPSLIYIYFWDNFPEEETLLNFTIVTKVKLLLVEWQIFTRQSISNLK